MGKMKRLIFLHLLALAIPVIAFSQCNSTSTGNTCQDSIRLPDPYHHPICIDFAPVCGCDGNTYRNFDAAYWWGAINMWLDGPCDIFAIDVYPNVITRSGEGLGHLRIYTKEPGTATMLIYDVYGKLMFEHLFETSLSNAIIPEANPYELYAVQNFPRGLYLLTVTFNGLRETTKLLKIEE